MSSDTIYALLGALVCLGMIVVWFIVKNIRQSALENAERFSREMEDRASSIASVMRDAAERTSVSLKDAARGLTRVPLTVRYETGELPPPPPPPVSRADHVRTKTFCSYCGRHRLKQDKGCEGCGAPSE